MPASVETAACAAPDLYTSWRSMLLLATACMLVIGLVLGLQVQTLRDIGARDRTWPWVAALGRTRIEVLQALGDPSEEMLRRLYRAWTSHTVNGVLTAIVQDHVVIASPFDDETFSSSAIHEAHRLLTAPLSGGSSEGTMRRNVHLNIPRAYACDVSYQHSPRCKVWVVTFCVDLRKPLLYLNEDNSKAQL
jgi:hypothetical protein